MKKDLAASEAADVSLLTRVVLGIFASDEHAARREKVATAMGLQVHFSLSKMSGEKKYVQKRSSKPVFPNLR